MRQVKTILNAQDWASLDRPLRAAGADPAEAIPKLKRYAELILEWNSGVSNLLSHNDERRIVSRHILESVEPAVWMSEVKGGHFIDFGSGAGFPALPLAIAGIGARWTLVDSRRNKTRFLRKACEELELEEVKVVCSRLEDLAADPEYAGIFDGLTSRATAKINETLEMAAALVRNDGLAMLWKGSGSAAELEGARPWENGWALESEFVIGEGPTRVIRFRRRPTG